MLKKLISILILITAVFIMSPSLAMPENDQKDQGTITSTATTTMEVEPDTASFSAAIVTENKNLDRAIEENNKLSQKVYDSLKKLLEEEGVIKTSSFQTGPVYEYNKTSRKSELKGYRVSNRVYVETKKMDEIGIFLQTAIDNGANNINNLSFTVSDKDKYCAGLLKKAAKKASEKAEIIAEALEVDISGIKRVNSSCNRPFIENMTFGREALSAGKGGSIPVETGEVKIDATITIDFLIKNK